MRRKGTEEVSGARQEVPKSRVVHVRLSEQEHAAIGQAAAAAGHSISGFVRSFVLEGAGVRPFFNEDDKVILAVLITEIRAAGVNLNQIARRANASGRIDAAELAATIGDLQRGMAGMTFELRSLLGRTSGTLRTA